MGSREVTATAADGTLMSAGAEAKLRQPSLRRDAERMRKALADHRRSAELREDAGERLDGMAAMRTFSSSS